MSLFQLIFLYKFKIQNSHLISLTESKKTVLHQLLVNNIDKNCKIIATKKKKTIILALYHLFEKTLSLILIEKYKDKENLDLQNLIQFW